MSRGGMLLAVLACALVLGGAAWLEIGDPSTWLRVTIVVSMGVMAALMLWAVGGSRGRDG